MTLSEEDQRELEAAHLLLENPGLAAKLADAVGSPIEKAIARLPDGAQDLMINATEKALAKALNVALSTIKNAPGKAPKTLWHKGSVIVSGGVGGAFGLPATAVELPFATTVMLRSIADIARSHGESISDPNTKAACLEVFAFGGTSASDDGTDSGYFAMRLALAQQVSEAGKFLARSAAAESGPALTRFLSAIAQRLGVQMTHKAAVQLVPAVGAMGGATVNWLFMQHFQDMAQGHFTIRKLERKHGCELVRQEYDRLGSIEKTRVRGKARRDASPRNVRRLQEVNQGSRMKRGSEPRSRISTESTEPGYRNRNGQVVICDTGLAGNDRNQRVYEIECARCRHRYGANGSDIWQRRCPECDGGRPGLDVGTERPF